MSVTLYQGDCLTELGRVADHSVNLIAADLPYGTTQARWDVVIPFAPLWAQFTRILAPGGVVVLTAAQPFTSLCVLSNPAWFKYDWVWEKSNPTGFLDVQRRPLKAHESILVFYPTQPTYNPQKWQADPRFIDRRKTLNPSDPNSPVYGSMVTVRQRKADTGERNPLSIISVPTVRAGRHPTEKPLALMEYLIATYSNPGDVVCDPTFGSGTTGEAAINLDRAFIGCEQDATYFAIGEARCAAALARVRQLPLAV